MDKHTLITSAIIVVAVSGILIGYHEYKEAKAKKAGSGAPAGK